MVEDDLKITNEIWQKWSEEKIKPPMTWQQLWDKVREYIRAGKDPYLLLAPTALERAEQKQPLAYYPHTTGTRYVETRLPWTNPEPEAIVEVEEIPTFSPAFLSAVKKAWESKQTQTFWEWIIEPVSDGVLAGLRGASRPHEKFPKEIIESMEYSEATRKWGAKKGVTFYFETALDRDRARDLLAKHNFYFPDGPDFSLTDIDNPDYMLELLAYEGFDTSRITVERS
jgi:hypothetical protein